MDCYAKYNKESDYSLGTDYTDFTEKERKEKNRVHPCNPCLKHFTITRTTIKKLTIWIVMLNIIKILIIF